MNIKETDSKKLFKEFELEIPYEEVDKLIAIKINEIIPTVSLPGFRKGKAPINIVRKKYENNYLSEVIEKIVSSNTEQLLEEKKIKAFRQPRIEIKKYQKNEPVIITIKIDIDPEIEIYPFDKIDINKYIIDLDKKTLDQNYKSFLDSQKEYKKVDNARAIKNKDRAFINIKTSDNSVPDFIKSQENLPIVTDSDYQVLPDIGQRLIDKKVVAGDKIKLIFDLKDLLKEKNKKEAEFEIEILSIEESVKFEVNKSFLDKYKMKSEKELQENIKQNLLNQYGEYLHQIEKKELMDILDSKNKFDVPEGIFDEEFNVIWHRLEHAKKDNKLDEDDKGLSDDKLKDRYKKIALRRVKLAILMQHIAKKENINISEKELSEGMMNYASQYPGQEKQIFEYFKNNPSSIESIRGPILEKKIVDFIFSKTNIKNKKISVKEFNDIQESAFKPIKE